MKEQYITFLDDNGLIKLTPQSQAQRRMSLAFVSVQLGKCRQFIVGHDIGRNDHLGHWCSQPDGKIKDYETQVK